MKLVRADDLLSCQLFAIGMTLLAGSWMAEAKHKAVLSGILALAALPLFCVSIWMDVRRWFKKDGA